MFSPELAPEIRNTLQVIEVSQQFCRNNRLASLLRLLVNHELDNPQTPLKAYSIATVAFGRSAKFDPATDSIVRVEVARLRTALKLFYANAPEVSVIIDIPKGTYRPQFQLRASGKQQDSEIKPEQRRWNLPSRWWIAATAGALLMLVFLFQRANLSQPLSRSPVVIVAPVIVTGVGSTQRSLVGSLTTELAGELASYPWITVVYGGTNDKTELQKRTKIESRTVYAIELEVNVNQDQFSWLGIIRKVNAGSVLWRSSGVGMMIDGDTTELRRSVQHLASTIAQPFGVVSKAEVADLSQRTVKSEYDCLIAMRTYLQDYAPDAWKRFKDCAFHESGANATSPSPIALALRSMALLHQARWHGGADRKALLEAASKDAEAAYHFRNDIQIVYSVTIRSRACQEDIGGVQEIANRLLRERPNHPTALADLSQAMAFSLGNETLGVQLARRAQELSFEKQRWHAVVPAIAALRQGNRQGAQELLGNVSSSNFPLGLLVGLALSDAEKDGASIRRIQQRFAEIGLGTQAQILGLIENECWTEDYKAMLRPLVAAALVPHAQEAK